MNLIRYDSNFLLFFKKSKEKKKKCWENEGKKKKERENLVTFFFRNLANTNIFILNGYYSLFINQNTQQENNRKSTGDLILQSMMMKHELFLLVFS